MAEVFIGVGSNENAEQNVRGGMKRLQQKFGMISLSTVYESEPIGFEGDNFLNLVARFGTDKNIHEVQTILKDIEDEFGRIRDGVKFGPRSLDLDLLLYDQVVNHVQDNDMPVLPRPEIEFNAFVLWPLAELIPHQEHPVKGEPYQVLWHAFDKSKQTLWPVEFDWSEPDAKL